ncbi:MAG TPA: hypothetical protein VHK69_19600 [Chitinophagaceae bacterium]|jgi:hypothetical protein|nr:hypothetical protein [Chitinophagaceae bacterium]
MVLTDNSQLAAECSEWRQILRNYREEFQDCTAVLRDSCRNPLSKNQYQEVEHFQNQFHIQLINIHDLKQEIKRHERRIASDQNGGDHSDALYAHHEQLLDRFLTLENTLQELRNDFRLFINATSC